MNLVSLKNVSFKYATDEDNLFSKLDFQLQKGEIAVLTGPSGSGKTTLAYCACKLIPDFIEGVFHGQVEINGRPVMVFQDPDNQIFLPSVEDELAFAPENLCLPSDEIRRRIGQVLQKLNIEHLGKENPALLSVGEKLLVALGGVLTLNPDIIILDETLASFDSSSRKRVKTMLIELAKEGKAVLLIEHDKENYDIGHKIYRLEEGKIHQIDR